MKFKIHREGIFLITFFLITSGILVYLLISKTESTLTRNLVIAFLIIFNIWLIYFFRVPNRKVILSDMQVVSPADGQVVAIEPVLEKEWFGDKRMQISIFMTPINAHVNWAPIEGIIRYFKYYKGNYIVAFHPKSSEKNEHTTIVIENGNKQILLRQIAGILARRIKSYVSNNYYVKKGDELGFIRFGSRVDVILPKDVKIKVKIGQKIKGGETVLCEFIN